MVGIYMFTNRCTGKSYVGQSTDIDRRYREHRFRKEDTLFHSELEYYGFHNFDFCVLEECSVSSLNDREIFYIKEYRTLTPYGYNATPGGTQPHVNALSSLEDVDKIIALLKEDVLTNGQIGKIFGITDQMVSDINCGRCWRQDDLKYPIRDGRRKRRGFKNIAQSSDRCNDKPGEPKRCAKCGRVISNTAKTGVCQICYNTEKSAHIPPAEILVEQLRRGSFESVARIYGVTSNAVRRWCDKYGISRHSKDYRSLIT